MTFCFLRYGAGGRTGPVFSSYCSDTNDPAEVGYFGTWNKRSEHCPNFVCLLCLGGDVGGEQLIWQPPSRQASDLASRETGGYLFPSG